MFFCLLGTECRHFFLLINVSSITTITQKNPNIRVAESILNHCFLTVPFYHFWLLYSGITNYVMHKFYEEDSVILLSRLPIPSGGKIYLAYLYFTLVQ